MAMFQLPGSAAIASTRDLALVDYFWRRWSPGLSLEPDVRDELHATLSASMPAPVRYYRAMARPGMLRAARRLSRPLTVPMLQLHGADDDCILASDVDDRRRFAAQRVREVVPDVGHFLQIESPEDIAERIATWTGSSVRGGGGSASASTRRTTSAERHEPWT